MLNLIKSAGTYNVKVVDENRLYALLGQRIKDYRLERDPKLSQAALAARLGVQRTSITNLESGSQRAPLHLIYALCAELAIEPGELIPALNEVMDKQIETGAGTETVPPKTAIVIDRYRNES